MLGLMVEIAKYSIIFVLALILVPFTDSQVTLETDIANGVPTFTSVQTYSRYTNATDNFPVQNFSICIGETNRTILVKFVAQDKNSNVEIRNVTWKVVSLINNTETTIPSFGSSFREAVLEANTTLTDLSYLGNVTLTNNGTKALYKVIVNVTDIHNASSINTSLFTLHKTDCIRVEQNATLVQGDPFFVHVDYCELGVVVNENVTGKIIVTLHNDSPVDSNVQTALDKYITVDVEGVILQQTINLSLITNYTQSEVENKGIDEDSLRIYKFGSWNEQEGNVDASSNEVLLIVNESTISNNYSYRLGTYSIRGTLEESNEESSSGSSESSAGGGSGGSGGGGGGGGSFLLRQEPGFSLEEDLLKVFLKQDSESGQQLAITNTGNIPITIELVAGDLAPFIDEESDVRIVIPPGEEGIFNLKFAATDYLPGVYTGQLTIRGGGIEKTVNVVIDVESSSLLFDTDVEILPSYKERTPGEDLVFEVFLFNPRINEKVDVEFIYTIKDFHNNELVSERERKTIDPSYTFTHSLQLPSGDISGDHVLAVHVIYQDSVSISSDLFYIKKKAKLEKPATIPTRWWFWALLFLALLMIVSSISYWSFAKLPSEKSQLLISLLEEIMRSFDQGRIDLARSLYVEAAKMYSNLPFKEKILVYSYVRRTYTQLYPKRKK